MSRLQFRSCSDADLAWLDSVHTWCMKEHVERHYVWKPQLFKENFEAKDYTVIQVAGEDVGFFKLIYESEQFYLADLMIAPDYQGSGIGGEVLDHLIARGSPVYLQVLKSSPAIRLYQKKGFRVTKETEHHLQMKLESG